MQSLWDSWIPGVLSKAQLRDLCENDLIRGVSSFSGLDHSAIDLHVTKDAYSLVRGSVKPFGAGYLEDVVEHNLVERLESDDSDCFHLEPKHTYLFGVQEKISANADGSLWGQATAKSSIGRLDVLVRLIVDGSYRYESFAPKEVIAAGGEMFVEVTPITFPIVVKPGTSLNQLRLFYGKPGDCELRNNEVEKCCLSSVVSDHHLTVDLTPVDVEGKFGCGFRASSPSGVAIPLWSGANKLDPSDSWELVAANKNGRLNIEKNHFYILRSKERLSLPPGIAVYARAIDEEIGEMRIHYAGFVHPFFGWNRGDQQRGTPLVFEVRCHDVDVSLRDGEVLARLEFFRMSRDAVPDGDSSYNTQTVMLSKYFDEWKSPPRSISESS